VQCFTSPPTQYRLYGRRFLQEDKLTTDTTRTKDNPEKANNTKYSKTKLAWFSRLLRHSARKRGGLILQCSRAHTAEKNAASCKLACLESITTAQEGDAGNSTMLSVIDVLY